MCMPMAGQSQQLTQWFTKWAQHNIKIKYNTTLEQTLTRLGIPMLAISFISKISFNTWCSFSGVETS